jgi:hypothetical protein
MLDPPLTGGGRRGAAARHTVLLGYFAGATYYVSAEEGWELQQRGSGIETINPPPADWWADIMYSLRSEISVSDFVLT